MKKDIHLSRKYLAFEIDFNYFNTFYWPLIEKKFYNANNNINSHLVWTEIYCYIKGSVNSHLYYDSKIRL